MIANSVLSPRCQLSHWQFDEEVNAAHSTLMLRYYLHGMNKTGGTPARQRKAVAVIVNSCMSAESDAAC